MKLSKLLFGLMISTGGVFLLGVPLSLAQDATTPIQNLEQKIDALTQDIQTDRTNLDIDRETVKSDREALKTAEASGNAAAIQAAKDKLEQDLKVQRKAEHDLDKNIKERDKDADLLKDLKQAQKIKDEIATAKAQLDQVENQVQLDVSALKTAQASGNATAIQQAKEKLEADRKVSKQDRSIVEHDRKVLETLKKDIHHDRRQIKHGK